MQSFFTNKIEEKILTFKNKPIFDTYLKEFIILMGNIGGKSSLSILFSIIKKDLLKENTVFIHWENYQSYQRISSYQKNFFKRLYKFYL